mmetsp:Transcript_31476/g.90672  ORF Transcript_31476/g.90672 Transcript_31476/m.90672 type:complete len:212 (+) Transcript_31476:46-681(+)
MPNGAMMDSAVGRSAPNVMEMETSASAIGGLNSAWARKYTAPVRTKPVLTSLFRLLGNGPPSATYTLHGVSRATPGLGATTPTDMRYFFPASSGSSKRACNLPLPTKTTADATTRLLLPRSNIWKFDRTNSKGDPTTCSASAVVAALEKFMVKKTTAEDSNRAGQTLFTGCAAASLWNSLCKVTPSTAMLPGSRKPSLKPMRRSATALSAS